jgi:hypothetical protein
MTERKAMPAQPGYSFCSSYLEDNFMHGNAGTILPEKSLVTGP